MAKDEHVVIRSGLITVIVLSVFWPAIQYAGGAIALSNPDISPMAEAMIWAALNLMPVLAGSLLLTGIVAAGLSSASTFLTLVGFAITNDIAPSDSSDDRRKLRLSRITILAVGVGALAIALVVPPSIFWITFFIGPLFAASWGPVAFMSVWSSRITEPGAFWGMIGGFLACVIPKALVQAGVISLPVVLDPIVIGATVSVATIILVSRRTEVRPEEIDFRQMLHVTPPELSDVAKNRRTKILPIVLMVWGLISSIGIVIIYVRPYQLATGLVETGGAYVVWSGELLAAISFGAILFIGGLIAHASLKRFLRVD